MDLTITMNHQSLTNIPASFVMTSSTPNIDMTLSTDDAYCKFSQILKRYKVIECRGRVNIVNWCASMLILLHQGKLRGVGHCAVVIGERGVGKSFLMQQIAKAAVEFVANTITCYIQYNITAFSEVLTPLEVLIHHMKDTYKVDWSAITSIALLHMHLEAKKQSLIFFIDGLDSVFAGDSNSKCQVIITQLLMVSEMNCTPTRRIIVIATGSSPLRRLCFAIATTEDRVQYPSYNGLNFNDRKYALFTVGSLVSIRELLDAKIALGIDQVDAHDNTQSDSSIILGVEVGIFDGISYDTSYADQGEDVEYDECHCYKELSQSRGVIQSIIELIQPHLPTTQVRLIDTMTESRHDPSLQKLWRVLLDLLRRHSPTRYLEAISDTSTWYALPTVSFRDMQAADPSITLVDLYKWVDRGYIALKDVHSESYGGEHLVTFGHWSDLMWAVTHLSGQPSSTRSGMR